jgi:GDPmannose 4,6-dehydratase
MAVNDRGPLPMKALIFGISGQDGQLLSRLLSAQRVEWLGVSRSGCGLAGDVADRHFVTQLISAERPTHIFHFAANSVTSHEALFDNHSAISTGTINILEAARCAVPGARIFLSGSALQLKNAGHPIDETALLDPGSAYATARIHSLYSGRYFREQFGMAVYFGYFFNHDSELRSSRHVNKRIAETAIRIAGGSKEKLVVGDPSVRKEFNYAGDTVRAVWTLVNQDRVFEAVIGSGEAHSIQEWIDWCFAEVGLNAADHVVTRDDFTPEYKVLVSNPALLRGLGWKPQVDFAGLVRIMMGAA